MRPIRNFDNPYIAAEISCNHLGDEDKAHALIEAAAAAGADAVKFQLFTPDDMATPDGPPLAAGPWRGRTLYDLYAEAMTPRAWFPRLYDHAARVGLDAFTSILNPADVEFLEWLDTPLYKIPSAEVGWLALIQAAAATGKPVIISSGMADLVELHAAVKAAQPGKVCLLHCVSAYPTEVRHAHLRRMFDLERIPGVWASGVSDHSLGLVVPVAATAVGAAMIEKHLMLPDTHPLDVGFSLTPDQFRDMVTAVRATYQALQRPAVDVERESRQYKRRLINGRWLRAGTAPE